MNCSSSDDEIDLDDYSDDEIEATETDTDTETETDTDSDPSTLRTSSDEDSLGSLKEFIEEDDGTTTDEDFNSSSETTTEEEEEVISKDTKQDTKLELDQGDLEVIEQSKNLIISGKRKRKPTQRYEPETSLYRKLMLEDVDIEYYKATEQKDLANVKEDDSSDDSFHPVSLSSISTSTTEEAEAQPKTKKRKVVDVDDDEDDDDYSISSFSDDDD